MIAGLGLTGLLAIPWTDLAGAALFYSNYFESNSWYTGHFWSLALEEHFYVLWPPLLVTLGRKQALWAGVLLVAVTIFLRHLTHSHAAAGNDLKGYTHLRLDAFMFPCILAILLRDTTVKERFIALMTPRAWGSLIFALGAGIALGVLVPGWREPQRVFQAAALPVIVVTTVLRPSDWIARQLQRPALEGIGRISYSIYLWQQLVFGKQLLFGGILIQIVLILAVAMVSRRWIEEPMIACGRRMANAASYGVLSGRNDPLPPEDRRRAPSQRLLR